MIKISQDGWLCDKLQINGKKTVFLYNGFGNNQFRQRILSASGLREMPDGEIEYWNSHD